MPEIYAILILFGVGTVAGFMNVTAGGGSTLTLPTLIFLGLDVALANGTNRIAIIIQNMAAVYSFKRDKYQQFDLSLKLSLLTLPGGIAGALIAVKISNTHSPIKDLLRELQRQEDRVDGRSIYDIHRFLRGFHSGRRGIPAHGSLELPPEIRSGARQHAQGIHRSRLYRPCPPDLHHIRKCQVDSGSQPGSRQRARRLVGCQGIS
jgi:hypothetical protein